jgi:hypothetical protein
MPIHLLPLSRRAAHLALFAVMLVLAESGWTQAHLVHPFGRTIIAPPDSAAVRTVRVVFQATYDRVRIERSEPGAPLHQHPVASLSAEQLRATLGALRRVDGAERELFNAQELTTIVPPLLQALGELTPQQEVSFAVTGRHGAAGPLVERSVTTGRMFRDADGLHLIVGLAQRQFESKYLGSGLLIAFEPGTRAAPVDQTLRIGAQGTSGQRRADWVLLAIGAADASATAVPASTPQAAVPAPAAPAATATAPAAAPAAPATPGTAAPSPAPRPRDAAFLAEQEERLKVLKRLRDQNLITEEEYQQKRREILQLL